MKSVKTWRKLWNTSRLNHIAWLETSTVTKAYHMKFYTNQSYSYRLSHTSLTTTCRWSWPCPIEIWISVCQRNLVQSIVSYLATPLAPWIENRKGKWEIIFKLLPIQAPNNQFNHYIYWTQIIIQQAMLIAKSTTKHINIEGSGCSRQ